MFELSCNDCCPQIDTYQELEEAFAMGDTYMAQVEAAKGHKQLPDKDCEDSC